MWNIYRQTTEFSQPWLLRFFDQIKFHPVSEEELKKLRRDFPLGQHVLQIEETEFDLKEYREFLTQNKDSIKSFTDARQQAFEEELQRWKDTGRQHSNLA